MRTLDQQCALHVKTKAIPQETLQSGNLMAYESWISFPETGKLVLYDSQGEVVSDSFEALFAILNLDAQSHSGHFGGTVLWTLWPKI